MCVSLCLSGFVGVYGYVFSACVSGYGTRYTLRLRTRLRIRMRVRIRVCEHYTVHASCMSVHECVRACVYVNAMRVHQHPASPTRAGERRCVCVCVCACVCVYVCVCTAHTQTDSLTNPNNAAHARGVLRSSVMPARYSQTSVP
jgi:hypothetical protein